MVISLQKLSLPLHPCFNTEQKFEMNFQLCFCFLLFDFRVTLQGLEETLEAVSTVNCLLSMVGVRTQG